MDYSKRDKDLPWNTIRTWLELGPNNLDTDPTSLHAIVMAWKKSFDLSGDELIEFVEETIFSLLKAWAMPVQGETTPEGYAGWRLDLSYGTEHRQIVDAIVKEWLDSEEDPSIGAVWFGKEKFYKKSR